MKDLVDYLLLPNLTQESLAAFLFHHCLLIFALVVIGNVSVAPTIVLKHFLALRRGDR